MRLRTSAAVTVSGPLPARPVVTVGAGAGGAGVGTGAWVCIPPLQASAATTANMIQLRMGSPGEVGEGVRRVRGEKLAPPSAGSHGRARQRVARESGPAAAHFRFVRIVLLPAARLRAARVVSLARGARSVVPAVLRLSLRRRAPGLVVARRAAATVIVRLLAPWPVVARGPAV